MFDLNKDVKYIKGVGPARADLLNSIGIFNLYDLITYFPRDYEDRGKEKNIAELRTCKSNAFVNMQIAGYEQTKRLINGLPDGYPMPMTRSE